MYMQMNNAFEIIRTRKTAGVKILVINLEATHKSKYINLL